MKKELRVLIFSAIINIIVSVVKIGGGLIFNSYTLIADGYYTISDFVTDFIALVGAKVSRRRANKKFPFGFGRVEYITQMFIGFIIFIIGSFVIYQAFGHDYVEPNMKVLYFVLIAIFLKILSSNYLLHVGKSIRSQILILSAKESFNDVISSTVVFFIIIIGQFWPIVDLIGTLGLGFLVIYSGIKIIGDNVLALIGEDDNNEEIKKLIKSEIAKYNDLEYSDSSLIKTGSYYQVLIEIAVNEEMRVNKLMRIENKIKKNLKGSHYKLKFIEFDIIAK